MLSASSTQEAFQMNQTAIGGYIARKRKGAESDTGAAGAAARRVQQDDLKMGERNVYAGLQHHSKALRRDPCDASGADGRRGCGREQRARLRQ